MNDLAIREQNAIRYDQQYIDQHGYWHDWVEKQVILKMLDVKPSDIVLDAGCGTGRITMELVKHCNRIWAFDYSKASVDLMMNKLPKHERYIKVVPLCHNITDNYAAFYNKFDKIACVQVIQHLESFIERITTLELLYRYLKPNGICVVTVYNANVFYLGKLKGEILERDGCFDNGIPYHRFFDSEIKEMFELVGFKTVKVYGCVNFGFHRLAKCYPLALLDKWISNYDISCNMGSYLIAKGIK